MNIKIYRDRYGFSFFDEWLKHLNDKALRARISARLDRIKEGNLGDHKFIAKGIWEFRLNFGAGYRIYFAKESQSLIILFIGGDKSSQKRDIEKAVVLLKDYLRNKNEI